MGSAASTDIEEDARKEIVLERREQKRDRINHRLQRIKLEDEFLKKSEHHHHKGERGQSSARQRNNIALSEIPNASFGGHSTGSDSNSQSRKMRRRKELGGDVQSSPESRPSRSETPPENSPRRSPTSVEPLITLVMPSESTSSRHHDRDRPIPLDTEEAALPSPTMEATAATPPPHRGFLLPQLHLLQNPNADDDCSGAPRERDSAKKTFEGLAASSNTSVHSSISRSTSPTTSPRVGHGGGSSQSSSFSNAPLLKLLLPPIKK